MLDIIVTTAQSMQSVTTSDAIMFKYSGATMEVNQYVSCVLEESGEFKYLWKNSGK